jgi:hypothetical protein
VGKTAALRSITGTLNPHRNLVLYQAETDFGRVDIYRGLARALGELRRVLRTKPVIRRGFLELREPVTGNRRG